MRRCLIGAFCCLVFTLVRLAEDEWILLWSARQTGEFDAFPAPADGL